MPNKEKIDASLAWEPPGHYLEYMLVIYSDTDYYRDVSRAIEKEVGTDWEVSDRGSRIEIRYKQDIHHRDDEKIERVVRKALGRRFVLQVRM